MWRERQDQLFSALLAHVQISFIALFLALMIAVPLGIHMTRRLPMPRQSTNRRGEDDKHLFPYYQGGPLMRSGSDTAKRYL
ncbi:hypothetical protein O0V01_13785 [Paenibacillus thiaminolyticus]|nr:hypothetical protein [Paenibacillus thiaminolyticus]WII40085.1 hypothetical protein O0V01_13785 [Paenibacillus thiaminolyticus]